MGNKRESQLIKLLLKNLIIKQREEEKFIKYINENNNLYNIDISSKIDFPIYEIAEILEIEKEEEAEKIFRKFFRKNKNVSRIVNKFCKKYDI